MTSLQRASMIWEMEVGAMSLCPWEYPRKAARQPTHTTAGASALMPAAALVSFIMAASVSALKYITKKEIRPRDKNRSIDTRKVLRI